MDGTQEQKDFNGFLNNNNNKKKLPDKSVARRAQGVKKDGQWVTEKEMGFQFIFQLAFVSFLSPLQIEGPRTR